MDNIYFQTGDVLYFYEEKLPKKIKEIKGDLIHKGQNHHHKINGKFKLYDNNGVMFIKAISECDLTHEEHKTIKIPKGIYRKSIVMEYDHFLEESREVID